MNSRELVAKFLIDPDAVETRPFSDEYADLIVMRHKSNNKWFGLIFEHDGELCANVKAHPDLIPVLKEQYAEIKPAWHMNKKHWCLVRVNNLPPEVLEELISVSFRLTDKKSRKRK